MIKKTAGLCLAALLSSQLMAADTYKDAMSINIGFGSGSTNGDSIASNPFEAGLKFNTLALSEISDYELNLRASMDYTSDLFLAGGGAGLGYNYGNIYGEAFVEYSQLYLGSSDQSLVALPTASGMTYGVEAKYNFHTSIEKHFDGDKVKKWGVGLRYKTGTYSFDTDGYSDITYSTITAFLDVAFAI